MIYSLNELLAKMGAPEVKEKGRIEWFYFDADKKDLAGAAEIRMEAGGERLIAELKHIRNDYQDDDGKHHDKYAESFYMYAERTARPGFYRVVSISFDGATYDKPKKPVIEMGLAAFHAKALNISVAMIEQSFTKADMLEPIIDPKSQFKKFMQQKTAGIAAVRKEGFGVVIPFRPRVKTA